MPLWWRKIQGTLAGYCFDSLISQPFVQMALWDTLGSGMDQHFAPELFAGASKTTTFYKVLTVTGGHSENAWKTTVLEHLQE